MQKYTILVVEDEAIISLGIQEELAVLGYEVAPAAYKGEEALRLAESHHVDLVLMDINLRGKLDGIETAIQLRDRHQIPVVFLTVAVDHATIQRAKVAEPYGYIIKPFSQDDLRITIDHALNKYQLELKVRQSEAHFRELFETSQDGILIADLNWNILDSNPAFRKFLGYGEDDLQKLKISHLTPEENRTQETKVLEDQLLVQGYSHEIAKDYLHQYGSLVPASTRFWLRKDTLGQPVGYWAIIRDITLEKAAEKKIMRQADLSQQLVMLTALLNAQLDLSKLLETMCMEIAKVLNVEAAYVTLFDPEKDALEFLKNRSCCK